MNVEHDADRQRFVIHFDGEDAELEYELPGPRLIDVQHTYVPPIARGRGAAEALGLAAFDYAREQNLRVVPTCPFVRRWLEGHPELLELVDPPYGKIIGRRVQR